MHGGLIGVCVCHFHLQLGQTIEYLYPSDAISKEEASCIAFNSFPDNTISRTNGAKSSGRPKVAPSNSLKATSINSATNEAISGSESVDELLSSHTRLHDGSQNNVGEKLFCFRIHRFGVNEDLLMPFVPLQKNVMYDSFPNKKKAMKQSIGRQREYNTLILKQAEEREVFPDWLFCYVLYRCSYNETYTRGAMQRSFVALCHSPDGAIYEKIVKVLGRRVLCSFELAKNLECDVDDHEKFNASTKLDTCLRGALFKMDDDNKDNDNGHDIDQRSDDKINTIREDRYILKKECLSSNVQNVIYYIDKVYGDQSLQPVLTMGEIDNSNELEICERLQRLSPLGCGGWSSSIGSDGPVPRFCRITAAAAGFGTRILSKAGLFQALRGRASSLLPTLWTLWEIILSGESILIVTKSPEDSAAAVVALSSLLQPLPALLDFRPYMTIQDPLYNILLKNKCCDGMIVGVTNVMIAQTLSIKNVLSLEPSKWRISEKISSVGVQRKKDIISRMAVTSVFNTTSSLSPRSSRHEKERLQQIGILRKSTSISVRENIDKKQIPAYTLNEGFNTNFQSILRPCASLLKTLIDVDALHATTSDVYEAACMANDATLSSYFEGFTRRFLEPLKQFTSHIMIKLERSQPFNVFPSMCAFTIPSAIGVLEKSSGNYEFPISLYSSFLNNPYGKRWLLLTRRQNWRNALERWKSNSSTKSCFIKLREVGDIKRAQILSRLKSEIAEKIALNLIEEKAGMEVCKLCTLNSFTEENPLIPTQEQC